jgi:hypothetical protein
MTESRSMSVVGSAITSASSASLQRVIGWSSSRVVAAEWARRWRADEGQTAVACPSAGGEEP